MLSHGALTSYAMFEIPQKTVGSFTMPVYGLGTSRMGGSTERDFTNDDAADIAAIKNAIENGVTHLDTAEVYAGGHSETMLGEAIKGYNRSSLFIVSKVKPQHHRPEDLRRSFEAS